MGRGFVKGVAVGAVVATVVLIATSAVAGTGIGGVFNLGKTNSVDASSTLTGAAGSKMLTITNKGPGPALGLSVAPGVAPFTVGSKTKVKNLNADQLDGVDATGFIQGTGTALVTSGSADLTGILDPQVLTPLGTIPGLGSFEVGGANAEPGDDCMVTFTNSSGASLVVNGGASPGLADGATVELTGADARPAGANATFTIMSAGATTVATGQVAVSFGFPTAIGNFVCAGAVHALVNG